MLMTEQKFCSTFNLVEPKGKKYQVFKDFVQQWTKEMNLAPKILGGKKHQ